jgi:flagellin
MKSLASQAASGTVTDTERAYIQAEFSELLDEIDGTATSTRYNGQSLLDGTSEFNTGVTVMVGSDATDTISVAIDELTASSLGLSTATAASPADLVGGTTGYDASGGDVSFDVNGVTVTLEDDGGSGSDGVYSADDIADAINTALTAASITDVSASVDGTTGALTLSSTATGSTAEITLDNFTGVTASGLGFSDTSNAGSDAGEVSVATQADAISALDVIDTAIDSVSRVRAEIGATMSRFEFRAETIATSAENLTAANSSIMDVDIAAEQARLSSASVKTQAAVAAAAQANQMPEALLSLLR